MKTIRPTNEEWPGPGRYTRLRKSDGTRTALVGCPDCGKPGTLSDHTIADDGQVTPSLVCSYDDCGFHDHVRLEDWA